MFPMDTSFSKFISKQAAILGFYLLKYFSVSSKLQLEQEILNFSEGLRVIGVKPDEKLALFADNSCRWLVADQGMQQFILPLTSLPKYYVVPPC
jgi:long-subunit acyl-CoA synthetase (AMP-forming)